MTADEMPAAVAAPSDFSGTTALLVGVFLDLVTAAHHPAAEAWLRSHSEFRSRERHTELAITPTCEEDAFELEEVAAFLNSSIGRYSGYAPSEMGAVLKFRQEPHTRHPAARRRRELLAFARAAARVTTEEDDSETISQFIALLDGSDLGVARSATQEYELFGLEHLDLARDATMALVDAAEKALYKVRKSVPRSLGNSWPNNWSPPVQRLTVRSLLAPADEVRSRSPGGQSVPPLVGVLTSGGDAAPGDVTHKLQRDGRIQVRHERVILGQGNIARQLMRALDRLRDDDPLAYIIGFGGASADTLNSVVDGLAEQLGAMSTPTYVGIGHRNFARKVGSNAVRWCLTPSAAVDLFLAESVEFPLRRAAVYERAARELKRGVGNAVALEAAMTRLRDELAEVKKELHNAERLNMQP